MLSIQGNIYRVKENLNGTFPGGGDRATLESDLSTLPAPSGHVPFFLEHSDGVNAENSGGEAEGEGATPPSSTSLVSHRHISTFDLEARVYQAFIEAGVLDKAESFIHCGEDVYTLECCQCGYRHTVRYNCKLRICPRCASVKVSVLMDKYLPYVEGLNPDNVRRIDLTIKNVEDLKQGVDKVRDSFTKLRRRDYYKRRIQGGIYGIEANPGKDGKWNVHLHFLYYGSYIPQSRLSDDWKDITGDSPVVWISRPRNSEKALWYVVKYVTKGVHEADQWTEAQLVEFVLALENVRLIQAFGCFLGRIAQRPPFVCPRCGHCIWRVLDKDGEVVFDRLSRLLWDYRNRSP